MRVQADYLTHPLILRAIATAKRRGLDVEAILDKSQDRHDGSRSRYTGATYLANAGVPVWIDDAPAIADQARRLLRPDPPRAGQDEQVAVNSYSRVALRTLHPSRSRTSKSDE